MTDDELPGQKPDRPEDGKDAAAAQTGAPDLPEQAQQQEHGKAQESSRGEIQEKNQEKKQEQARQIEAPAKQKQQGADRKSGRGALGAILKLGFNLILLALIGGLGWMLYEQRKEIDVLFSEYNTLTQQRNALEQGLARAETAREELLQGLQEQIEADREQLAQQAEQLAGLNRELVDMRLRLSRQSGASSQAWRLTEAESLLRLARERLLYARDINTVISLYLSADDLLSQLNDPAVQSVRDILANELDTLRGVNLPDIQGMHARLGEYSERVAALSVAPELDSGELRFQAPEAEAGGAEAGWLDDVGSTLSRFFVLRRGEAPRMSQLTPEQVYLIKQLIRLQIEEARIALLRGDTRVYQNALDNAMADIGQYLEGADKQPLLDELMALRNTSIVAQIPPVGSTLNAIRQIAPESIEGAAGGSAAVGGSAAAGEEGTTG